MVELVVKAAAVVAAAHKHLVQAELVVADAY
jgi:hypothetical protein